MTKIQLLFGDTKKREAASEDVEATSGEVNYAVKDTWASGLVRNRVLAAWEIISVVLSFLIVAWIVMPFAPEAWLGLFPLGLAVVLIYLSHRTRHETRREIGWRFDNFGQAWRLLALPMLLGGCVILAFGWLKGSLHFDKALLWRWSLWLPVWGLLQQYVLQGFINRRAQIVCGKSGIGSVLIVAAVFALLHLPNPWLALWTFAGGAIYAHVYQRAPNLFALGLSHGLMALVLASSLSAATLNNLRVGFRYFG